MDERWGADLVIGFRPLKEKDRNTEKIYPIRVQAQTCGMRNGLMDREQSTSRVKYAVLSKSLFGSGRRCFWIEVVAARAVVELRLKLTT